MSPTWQEREGTALQLQKLKVMQRALHLQPSPPPRVGRAEDSLVLRPAALLRGPRGTQSPQNWAMSMQKPLWTCLAAPTPNGGMC